MPSTKLSLPRLLTLIAQESEQLNSLSFRMLALLLSVSVHVLVYLSIGIAHGERGDQFRGSTLDVRLLPLETRPSADAILSVQAAIHQESAAGKHRGSIGDGIGRPDAAARQLVPLFEISLPPEPYYFPTDQLSENPQVTEDIPPSLAVSLGNGGDRKAILRLLINESGMIDQVIVEDSNFSEEEKKLIIEACKQMKFKPGKLDEMPVNTEMRIEMTMEGAEQEHAAGTKL